MRIIASPLLCIKLNQYAKKLLNHFVHTFEILYGKQLISYNVHGLLHLPDDVLKFGSVDNFSCFDFENHLQKIKKLLRKGDRPLQQIGNRLHEEHEASLCDILKLMTTNALQCFGQHYAGPTVRGCGNPQYTSVLHKGFFISLKIGNNCCILNNGSIVVIKNIATFDSKPVIVGKQFLKVDDAYTIPCRSSEVGTFLANELSKSLRIWSLSKIRAKALKLPTYTSGKYLIVSIIHHQLEQSCCTE